MEMTDPEHRLWQKLIQMGSKGATGSKAGHVILTKKKKVDRINVKSYYIITFRVLLQLLLMHFICPTTLDSSRLRFKYTEFCHLTSPKTMDTFCILSELHSIIHSTNIWMLNVCQVLPLDTIREEGQMFL